MLAARLLLAVRALLLRNVDLHDNTSVFSLQICSKPPGSAQTRYTMRTMIAALANTELTAERKIVFVTLVFLGVGASLVV